MEKQQQQQPGQNRRSKQQQQQHDVKVEATHLQQQHDVNAENSFLPTTTPAHEGWVLVENGDTTPSPKRPRGRPWGSAKKKQQLRDDTSPDRQSLMPPPPLNGKTSSWRRSDSAAASVTTAEEQSKKSTTSVVAQPMTTSPRSELRIQMPRLKSETVASLTKEQNHGTSDATNLDNDKCGGMDDKTAKSSKSPASSISGKTHTDSSATTDHVCGQCGKPFNSSMALHYHIK